jgi:FKBP-type peptidyl-prolyl cis-trans isomerase SlyD
MGKHRLLSWGWSALFALLVFIASAPVQAATDAEGVIHPGSVVSFNYTLKDEDGKVIDSSEGKAPMSYTHGKGEIIPGLENELTGLKVGNEKHVTVKPENGYGPVDPRAFQEIEKEKLPPEALKVGTVLTAHGPGGQSMPVRVHEIKEKTVIMDFNHPLAGKTLTFDVKITEIKSGEN